MVVPGVSVFLYFYTHLLASCLSSKAFAGTQNISFYYPRTGLVLDMADAPPPAIDSAEGLRARAQFRHRHDGCCVFSWR